MRLLRTDAGLSLRQLAARIGVSSAYLSRVENGHDAPPTGERLASIARELSIPPELLMDMGDRLAPTLASYIDEVPTVGRLFLEIAHRRLDAGDVDRLRMLIEREFPRAGDSRRALPPIAALLPPERIVLQLSCTDLEDAIDVAASRLWVRNETPAPRQLAADLLARESEASTSVGKGVAIPRTFVPGWEPRMVLVTLARKVRLKTPDGVPLRALFVMVSPNRGFDHIARMAQIARLANRDIADELEGIRSPERARACLAASEERL